MTLATLDTPPTLPFTGITALDLFAGTGWGVACQRLGITEGGVELMPEANASREANGMHNLYSDVWDGLENPGKYPWFHHLLIASPPCQTFSMAGSGKGRAALDDVLHAINVGAYKDVAELRALGEATDPRTALVLTPLAHVYRDWPRYVVFEQVPPVLPVWEACAEVMEGLGYSVWTGILNAEQYGVPQTRRRAVLIARLGEPVAPPVPTHSRYYSRDPGKLDPGVQKWVSMAEALGWEPGFEVISNYGTGGDSTARGGRTGNEPSATVTSKVDRNRVEFVSNNKQAHSARRDVHAPAPTITAGHDSGNRVWASKNMGAGMIERHGDRPGRSEDQPAFSIRASAGGTEPGGFVWSDEERTWTRKVTVEEAAILQSYPAPLRPEIEAWRWKDAPATTVAADPRITAREHHYHGEQAKTALKLTFPEASTLQSYPRGFEFSGARTKQFLQVGNAVPPLLAEAILRAVLA